jgi:hypothetical protein
LTESKVTVYASGLSSKARALDATALEGMSVELAPPDKLVELIVAADSLVSY